MPTSARPKAKKVFDYTSLDAETFQFVQQQTGEIRVLMKRTAQGIVEIGQKLTEVKERLGHGRFGNWLEAEFDWSWDTAVRFMNVASRFGDFSQIAKIAPSALYILASPSTPKTARKEAIARAEAGESITYTAAKAIKQKHKKPMPPEPRSELEPKLKPEPVSQPQPTPIPAPPPQSGSKLEIIAIRPQGQVPALPEATRVIQVPPEAQTLSAPQPSQPAYAPEQLGVWWQLGGRHLLYYGDPNSPEFLARVRSQEVSLLFAFPLYPDWQPAIRTRTHLIVMEYLPQGKDLRLFEDALETLVLLYSRLEDTVVSCFLPEPEIISIVNRLERRGLFAEPDSRRCQAVIADWKRAGLKVERIS